MSGNWIWEYAKPAITHFSVYSGSIGNRELDLIASCTSVEAAAAVARLMDPDPTLIFGEVDFLKLPPPSKNVIIEDLCTSTQNQPPPCL